MVDSYYNKETHGYMRYPDDSLAFFIYSLIERPIFNQYKHAIEIGAGMGRFSTPIIEKFEDVTLIEPNTSFAEYLQAKCKDSKARILVEPGETALTKIPAYQKSVVFCFHLMHHLQCAQRSSIYTYVKASHSLGVLVEPNPINPLILLQVLAHPDMRLAEERQYLSFGKKWYHQEIQQHGLSVLEYRRFCFLPPFIANYALHKGMASRLQSLENFNVLLPFLSSYQLVIYGAK